LTNQITQSLIAVLAGLRVPFVCTETHEMGEEILASYLYQVHLYQWLEKNGFGSAQIHIHAINFERRGEIMPKDKHNMAAEHHEKAAKSHRTAAEHHGKGEHEAGQRHSSEALEHSKNAHQHSQEAHNKSIEANKKK
jgi:hypothetical protein